MALLSYNLIEEIIAVADDYSKKEKSRLNRLLNIEGNEQVADPLRKALLSTLTGLAAAIPPTEEAGISALLDTDKTSLANLRWMVSHCVEEIETLPVDKISRWIGFVRDGLAAKGILDVDAERDRTRPFFHEAYEQMGIGIPATEEMK